jgi:hypothetical protein
MSTNTRAGLSGGGRGQGNAPETGQSVELVTLADALALIKQRKTELEHARRLLDDELRRRVTEHGGAPGRVWITGEYELKLVHGREWDADELEGVLRALVDDGVLTPREVLGVIRHEPKVNGTNAARLLDRLDGDAHAAVRACHTWRVKGLQVERSQPLIPER